MVELKENQELNKYMQELDSDVELKVSTLREKSLMTNTIRSKWLQYYYHEKENLNRIKETKSKILKKKMESNKNADSVLRLKAEENIAKNDENILKLNRLQDITTQNLDFIEKALDILSTFGFTIKNCVEVLKLERS